MKSNLTGATKPCAGAQRWLWLVGVWFAICSGALAQTCFPPALDLGDHMDLFGGAVALNGEHAAVLAANEHQVYVYRREAGNWRRTARFAVLVQPRAPLMDGLAINATGTLSMCRRFLAAQGTTGAARKIVNLSSVGGGIILFC